jgi:hypothetical protein
MGSRPRLPMPQNGVPGRLINKTRCADARIPVVVGEMMKSALRNCTARFGIRLECNGNIEPSTRRLAPAASDDSSSRTGRCAHCTFVRMTRQKLDRTIGCWIASRPPETTRWRQGSSTATPHADHHMHVWVIVPRGRRPDGLSSSASNSALTSQLTPRWAAAFRRGPGRRPGAHTGCRNIPRSE